MVNSSKPGCRFCKSKNVVRASGEIYIQPNKDGYVRTATEHLHQIMAFSGSIIIR